jgi:SAM-dependent methyltransferase
MDWQTRYLERFYDPRDGWVNGTEEFHQLCASCIPMGSKILEIGPGPSNKTSRFLATRGELHGLDPDPDVLNNQSLQSAAVLEGDRYPFEDGAFDACVSNYVVEHVADPRAHLREISRVLRNGGPYIFRTPNQYHYVAMVARLTPHWFHELVANRLRNRPLDAHPPYPTVYKMNTGAAVHRLAQEAGLRVETLRLVEKEPSYGLSSRALFLAFVGYERLVNSTESAASLRANIFGVLRKGGGARECFSAPTHPSFCAPSALSSIFQPRASVQQILTISRARRQ